MFKLNQNQMKLKLFKEIRKINVNLWLKLSLLTFLFFPVLLNAQSKKEEIILLNLRIDSINNTYNLEKTNLEKKIIQLEIENSLITTKLDKCSGIVQNLNVINQSEMEQHAQLKTKSRYDSIQFSEQIILLTEEIREIRDSASLNKFQFSNWVLNNLNLKIPNIQPAFTLNAILDDALKELIKEDYWLGMTKINEIKFMEYGLVFNLNVEDYYIKSMIINPNFVMISYHLDFGSDGNAIVINLKNMNVSVLDGYYINSIISDDELIVEKDYYDDQGHVWETGKYNLETQHYEMISIEH